MYQVKRQKFGTSLHSLHFHSLYITNVAAILAWRTQVLFPTRKDSAPALELCLVFQLIRFMWMNLSCTTVHRQKQHLLYTGVQTIEVDHATTWRGAVNVWSHPLLYWVSGNSARPPSLEELKCSKGGQQKPWGSWAESGAENKHQPKHPAPINCHFELCYGAHSFQCLPLFLKE